VFIVSLIGLLIAQGIGSLSTTLNDSEEEHEASTPLMIESASGSASANTEPSAAIVSAADIPVRVQIIGKLGRPLGELVKLRGRWEWPEVKHTSDGKTIGEKYRSLQFRAEMINGVRIDLPVTFRKELVQFVGKADKRPPTAGAGDVWEIQGAESGGFYEHPPALLNELWEKDPRPNVSWPCIYGFKFVTKFAYVSWRAGDWDRGGDAVSCVEKVVPAVRTIRSMDIPDLVQITGVLQRPLGEVLNLRGCWVSTREVTRIPSRNAETTNDGSLWFRVDAINEKAVAPPVVFRQDRVNYVGKGGFGPPNPKEGEVWELRGAEAGGFIELPPALLKEIEEQEPSSITPSIYGFKFVADFSFISWNAVGARTDKRRSDRSIDLKVGPRGHPKRDSSK